MQIIVNESGMAVATHADGQDVAGLYAGATIYLAPDGPAPGPDATLADLGGEAERAEWLAAWVRGERDRRLAASDARALADYPHADEAARTAWLDYRQALRDVPGQEGFPTAAIWPAAPEG